MYNVEFSLVSHYYLFFPVNYKKMAEWLEFFTILGRKCFGNNNKKILISVFAVQLH